MLKKIDASFIVINYNGKKYLSRLIHSIQQQEHRSFEIIIVDNESVDNSVNYLQKNYPSIKLIKSSNIGFGLGCNLGAKYSRGKFLIFLNPDCYVPKQYLSNFLKFYSEKSSSLPEPIGCINCRVVDYHSQTTFSRVCGGGIVDIFGTPRESFNPERIEDSFFVFGTSLFIERKTLLKVGGFNPNIFLYGEEIDLCWRLKLHGYRHLIDNQNFFYHLGGGSFGKDLPRQVALMTVGCLISSMTNYQTITLLLIFPVYLIYLLFLITFLPVYYHFNFKYSLYLLIELKKYIFQIGKILKFRNFVQKTRTKNDATLLRYFSVLPSIIIRRLFHQPVHSSFSETTI